MSKYDFELDLSQNSSTGLLLGKIDKGDVVLEFGCATGRMTRYMQQELGCKVYIVEYEKSAFETALQYAEDGVCGDILEFEWYEKFKDIKFDAILFADVLEHLSRPESVIKKSAEMLKDDGHIYVSVPNITHNDIILKACNEHFDYTSVGLLDDTHIHFWGLENIKKLGEKCGMNPDKIEATYCETQETEQYTEECTECDILLKNILKERKGGEIYQFIVTFSKSDKSDAENTVNIKPSAINSHIYVDSGNGFTPDDIISFESVYSGKGSYIADYIVENTDNIKRIRFDPVEGQGCFVKNILVSQNEKTLKWISPDFIEVDEGVFIFNDDPMFIFENIENGVPAKLHAEIIVPGSRYLGHIQKSYVDNYICSQEELKSLNRLNEENYKTINVLKSEKEELEGRVAAYIHVANNKDKYILELEDNVAYLENLAVVRLYKVLLKILKKIKNRIKKIFR